VRARITGPQSHKNLCSRSVPVEWTGRPTVEKLGGRAGRESAPAPEPAVDARRVVWNIHALQAPFDRDRATAITTSRLVYLHDPSMIDSAGDGYLRAGGAFKHLHGAPSTLGGQSGEVFGACGAACMFRKDVYTDLGGFDEDFFMVYEDVDISYRARLRGYRCTYVADAVVHHAGSGTLRPNSAASVYYGQRNLEWTYLKNTPWPLLIRSIASHVLYDGAALVAYGSQGLLGPYLKGKWAALKGVPAILRSGPVRTRQGQRRLNRPAP